MPLPALIFLFIFGVFIGSFLNVVTLRYKPGSPLLSPKIIGGRSHCPNCGMTLRWYELVPLFSFFIQGMKCRHCADSLSWQYPLVEFITGLVTVALPAALYNLLNIRLLFPQDATLAWFYAYTALWLLISYTFIVIALIDLRHRIIPDQANVFLAILGIGLLLIKDGYNESFSHFGSFLQNYSVILGFQNSLLTNTILAVLVGTILFGGIILFTKGRGMGLGDLKLVIPIGIILGWPDILIAISASFILGSLVAIPLLLHKVKKMSDGIPFGPFLVLGVYVAIFYGYPIAQWYFSLI